MDIKDIDSTGVTNVSAQLNSYFASLPSGSIVDLVSGGLYRCDQTITLTKRFDLIIRGNEATILTNDPTGDGTTVAAPSKKARSRAHLRFSGCQNVTVDNLFIRGANPFGGLGDSAYNSALEGQHGFHVVDLSNGVTISDCRVTDVYGDFGYAGKRAANVAFLSLYGRRNGRQGISVTDADDVSIIECDLSDMRRTAIDLEPNTTKNIVQRVTIQRNHFGPNRLTWVSAGGKGHVNDILVSDNIVDAPANVYVKAGDGTRRSNWTLVNNTSTHNVGNPQGAAWKFTAVDGISAHGNNIMLQPNRNMYLIGVTDCTSVDVWGNLTPGGIGQVKP